MFTAYLNDQIFFSSGSIDESLKLVSASIQYTLGQAGSFSFEVAPDNIAYGQFAKFKGYVDVYRDAELIFSGRVLDDGMDFDTVRPILCEGIMAVLNDSVFRPVTYNGTLQGLVEAIVNSHNDQVDSEKQLTIGTITIENEYIYRAYETIETSWSRLWDLAESYGGFFQVNKVNGQLYLNWFEELPDEETQNINFGENILDIKQESPGDGLITVLVPQGAEVDTEDGTKRRVNIKSVNSNRDYVVNADAVEEFGLIVGTHIWKDVTQPARLKTKAIEYLADVSRPRVSIKLSVAEIALVENTSPFRVGQKILVTSSPHGLDNQEFIVRDRKLDVLDPTQNTMTIGETIVGYISRTNRKTNDIIQRVDSVVADYVTNDRVNDINQVLQQYYSEITQTSQLIESIVTQLEEIGTTLTTQSSRITQTSNQIAAFIDDNGETMSYFILDAQGLWIGKGSDPIRLLETSNAIKFVNSSGNKTLLEININGIIATTIAAKSQVTFLNGDTGEWAIRKGDVISNKHNLDFVYIGAGS